MEHEAEAKKQEEAPIAAHLRVEFHVEVNDSDTRSLRRLSQQSLFLLVRYGEAQRWTFPKADRLPGEAMRETLLSLAEDQLGSGLRPYLVGACPFSYRKRLSDRHPGIQALKSRFL